MHTNSKKRRLAFILIPICIVLAFVFGRILFELDKIFSGAQIVLIIVVYCFFTTALEILITWWDDKHRDPNTLRDLYDMVGKNGIVQKDCDPEGKVRVNQELWNAVSGTGEKLLSGEKIVVKERQGLKLIIEKIS